MTKPGYTEAADAMPNRARANVRLLLQITRQQFGFASLQEFCGSAFQKDNMLTLRKMVEIVKGNVTWPLLDQLPVASALRLKWEQTVANNFEHANDVPPDMTLYELMQTKPLKHIPLEIKTPAQTKNPCTTTVKAGQKINLVDTCVVTQETAGCLTVLERAKALQECWQKRSVAAKRRMTSSSGTCPISGQTCGTDRTICALKDSVRKAAGDSADNDVKACSCCPQPCMP